MAKPNPKAKKKLKKIEEEGAKVLNDKDESPIDTTINDKDEVEEDWNVKTLEVESDTKLEADKGEGQTLTLRHFFFKANQEQFKKHIPTAQELLNSHLKHIEIELWKDEWTIFPEVEPRLTFYDKLHRPVSHTSDQIDFYCFIVAALPSKGSLLSFDAKPRTLSQIAHEARNTQR